MSGTSRQLNKQDCIDLRRQLADLGYGQAESEEQELLGSRLYPVSEHLRALDPRVVLVVGPRGSGKSALFKVFFSENRDLAAAIARWMPKTRLLQTQSNASEWRAAYPAGNGFSGYAGTRDSGCVRTKSRRRSGTSCWSDVLQTGSTGASGTSYERCCNRTSGGPRPNFFEAYRDVANEPDRCRSGRGGESDYSTRILRIYIGYDELDTLGGFDWTLMARMVRGLVAFWSDYSRRWQRIRAKIFLRSDLFRRHAGMGTADFAKLAANRAELEWSDAALLAMLVKRIANTSEPLAAYCRGARIRFEEHDALGLDSRDQGTSRSAPSPGAIVRGIHGSREEEGLCA